MKKIILSFFVISGACGLIYEIIWIRMLCLVFGSTVFAVSTVLTTFMAGLAIGSYIFGRIIDKKYNQLFFYGLLELGVGLYALATPYLINLIKDIYVNIYRAVEPPFYYFSLIRFGLCLLVLLLPTIFMGGTLPILSKFFIRKFENISKESALLYGLNTIGAFLGTLLAGFLLLEYIGIKSTIQMAATLNIGIGGLAILFSRRIEEANAESISELTNREMSFNIKGLNIIILGFTISGFSSMLYEVAWTRILSSLLDSSVYAFSIMLATFLLGIALGSLFFGRSIKENKISMVLFAFLELSVAVGAIITMYVFTRFPFYFLKLSIIVENNYGLLQFIKFLLSAAVMFLPTFILGGIFPVVIKLCSPNIERVATSIGKAYAFNTIGCILGSFAGGFILIPLWGARNTILVGASLNFTVSMLMLLSQKRWRYSLISVSIFLIILLSTPGLDKQILTGANAAMLSRYYPGVLKSDELMQRIRQRGKLLYYKEGLNSTVSVLRRADFVGLVINGKVDASITYNYNASDMGTQLMVGYLPMLLSREPKDVLVIGYGSGVTTRAVAEFPVSNIYCVEIEPSVIEASRFFVRENKNVLNDPRVKLIINDARNYSLLTDKKFDVIISEPSNPWMAGVANLFSLEHFQLLKSRLSEKGIVCQWFHLYQISPEDIKAIIKTFQAVFPHASLWSFFTGDALLIGAKEKLVIDFNRFAQNFYYSASVKENFRKMHIESPWAIMGGYLMGEEELAKFSKDAFLNTDDQLFLEFSTPKSLLLDREITTLNYNLLKTFNKSAFPTLINVEKHTLSDAKTKFDIGYAHIFVSNFKRAMDEFKEARNINNKFAPIYMGIGMVEYSKHNFFHAVTNLKKAIQLDPKLSEAHFLLGRVYEDQDLFAEAEEEYKTALVLASEIDYKLAYGRLSVKLGNYNKAIELLKSIILSYPDDVEALHNLVIAYIKTNQTEEAIALLKEIIDKDPGDIEAYFKLGRLLEEKKDFKNATTIYHQLLELFPKEARAYLALGRIYNLNKDYKRAKVQLLRAIKYDRYILYNR